MKKLILAVCLLFNITINAQTVIEYDFMEASSTNYLTSGWWFGVPTATWATNVSVSSTISAVIYGSGNGGSGTEQDYYSMPNITGLSATSQYQLKFRLASYSFTSSATTKGVDVADYVDVQVSTNGGATYISELRITGNSNASWPYTSTGSINHTANGSYTNSAAPTGDLYQAPAGASTTGPTFISLYLPTGITQVAIDLFCRVNSAGEEWWIDNIELIRVYSLPVELTKFTGTKYSEYNMLNWQTASEHNSSHFILERTNTGDFTEKDVINITTGAGNSTQLLDYNFVDTDAPATINYYRLTQVDYDGNFKQYGPIAIDNRPHKFIVKTINLLGQPVTEEYHGIVINIYDDGTSVKKLQ